MKKLNNLNVLWMLALAMLFGAVPVQGMENKIFFIKTSKNKPISIPVLLGTVPIQGMENNLYTKKQRSELRRILETGVDSNNRKHVSLFEVATCNNDEQLVKTLLIHHADPNARNDSGWPIFFFIKNRTIAQNFIKHGLDVHMTNAMKSNVLSKVIEHDYPSDLMKFYLKHNVDPRQILSHNGNCLLHKFESDFAASIHECLFGIVGTVTKIDDVDNYLKKAKLLLYVAPDMVNTVNEDGLTPLDIAQRSLEYERNYNGTPEAYEQLVALYKKYDGKTGQEIRELQKEVMILLLHNDDCLGDLSVLLRDVRKDIVQYMIHLNK